MKLKRLIQNPVFAVTISVVLGLFLIAIANPKLAIIGGSLLCCGLSYKYPRTALWVFLIYLPFSGTLTYWLGGGNLLFQFAKDLFYFPALIGSIQYCRKEQLPIFISKPLILPLGLLLGLSLLTLISVNGYQQFFGSQPTSFLPSGGENGSEQPLMMGIIGLKTLVGYIPLIFCGYYLIRDQKELIFLTRLFVIITLICCLLSQVQYWLLVTGICQGTRGAQGGALFKAVIDAKCLVGGPLVFSPSQNMIRLPGTFVSSWQWSWFLISSAFVTAASTFINSSKPWRFLGFVATMWLFLAAVVSGQKMALMSLPLILIILFLVTRRTWKMSAILAALIAGSLVGLVAIAPDFLQPRISNFIELWNPASPLNFIGEQFQTVMSENLGLLGMGLGRATNYARVFGRTFLIETYYPKLLYEIGYFGLLAFLGVVTTLSWVTFKAWRSLSNKILRQYAICFWLFILFISYNTYYYPLAVDPVNVYYWFLAGVTLKLPSIDQSIDE